MLLLLLPRFHILGSSKRLGGGRRHGVSNDLLQLFEPGPVAGGASAGTGEPLALHLVAFLKVVDLVLTLLHALAPGSLALPVGHDGGHVLPVPTPQVSPVELLKSVSVGVEEAADRAVRPLLPILTVEVVHARDPSTATALLPPTAAAAAVDVGTVLAPIAAELLGALPAPLGVLRRLAALGVVVAVLLDLREGAGAGGSPRRCDSEAEGMGGLLRRRRRGLLGGGGCGRGSCRLVGVVTEEAEVVVAGGHGWPRVAALGLRRGLRSQPRRRR